MKMIGLLGLAAAAIVAVPASAQHVVTHRTVTHTEVHRAPVVHRRKVCTVNWSHNRKMRHCSWR